VVVILGLTLDKLEVLRMGPPGIPAQSSCQKIAPMLAPKDSEMGDDE